MYQNDRMPAANKRQVWGTIVRKFDLQNKPAQINY